MILVITVNYDHKKTGKLVSLPVSKNHPFIYFDTSRRLVIIAPAV